MRLEKKNIRKYLNIDWIQLFLIGLVAPFFLFPSVKYIWIFLIIPGIWICRWIVKHNFFERTLLDWAIFILFIQVFATCIIVPDISFSLPKIAGIFYGLAFFYAIVALLTSEKLIRLGIISFLGAGVMLSIFGILGMMWDSEAYFNNLMPKIEKIIPKIKWNLPGAEEGFNSNAIGGTLILIVPLCLILFLSYVKSKKESDLISYSLLPLIFFFIVLFVVSCVLFFTLSMGSWIGLIISIWILFFPLKWKKWSLLLIFISIAFFLLLHIDKTPVINEIVKDKIAQRNHLWLVGTNTINNHPFFGIGINRIRQIPSVRHERSTVHNHLLHTGAELGIPGLIAYLAILIGAGFMCFKIWRKSNIGWIKMTALGLGCGQLAHLIFGMGGSIPLGAKVGIFFWFSLGLIAAMYNYMLNNSLRNITSCPNLVETKH